MSRVIAVEGLGKKYIIKHQQKENYTALRDVIARKAINLGQKMLQPFARSKTSQNDNPGIEEFWAIKDISFEIKQGERVGIIGRNGAGKSTLLKLLSRITEPTSGRITINGRVASLLEVGTGFHPELTGRENVFLNGAVLGMGKVEIKKKFDEIVAFAEIDKFLDTPVKRYSSGMYVRLAFAVAAHLEPEILIVDEVLAVGDARFQKKCLGKMEDVSREGRTVLFVSHNMSTITSLCSKCILLENGQISSRGATSDVVMHYYTNGKASPASADFSKSNRKIGDEYARLLGGFVKNANNQIASEINIDEPCKIVMQYEIFKQNNMVFIPNFHFHTADGTYAFVTSDVDAKKIPVGVHTIECHIQGSFLNEGTYFVGLALSSFESGVKVHFYEQSSLSFNVKDPIEGTVTRRGYSGPVPGTVRPKLKWNSVEVL